MPSVRPADGLYSFPTPTKGRRRIIIQLEGMASGNNKTTAATNQYLTVFNISQFSALRADYETSDHGRRDARNWYCAAPRSASCCSSRVASASVLGLTPAPSQDGSSMTLRPKRRVTSLGDFTFVSIGSQKMSQRSETRVMTPRCA
jgi:hypothetical protein